MAVPPTASRPARLRGYSRLSHHRRRRWCSGRTRRQPTVPDRPDLHGGGGNPRHLRNRSERRHRARWRRLALVTQCHSILGPTSRGTPIISASSWADAGRWPAPMSRFCALPSAVRARSRVWLGGSWLRDLRRRPVEVCRTNSVLYRRAGHAGVAARLCPQLAEARQLVNAREVPMSCTYVAAYAGRAIGGMGTRYARWPGGVVRQGGTAGGSSAG